MDNLIATYGIPNTFGCGGLNNFGNYANLEKVQNDLEKKLKQPGQISEALKELRKIIYDSSLKDFDRAEFVAILLESASAGNQPVIEFLKEIVAAETRPDFLRCRDEALVVLKEAAAESEIALKALEEIAPLLKKYILNDPSSYFRDEALRALVTASEKSEKAAGLISEIKNHFLKLPVKEVLPQKRTGKKVVVIFYDDFGRYSKFHGESVQERFTQASGQIEIGIESINLQDGYRGGINTNKILEERIKSHLAQGDIILVNICVEFPQENYYTGISNMLSSELAEEFGKQGVVFVVAAGNENSSRNIIYPRSDNVLVIGEAKREKGEWRKSRISNYGIDIFCCAPGNGTSISTPTITGLLGKILTENPRMSVKEAIQLLKAEAQPMGDEPLYKNGLLGTGVIDF